MEESLLRTFTTAVSEKSRTRMWQPFREPSLPTGRLLSNPREQDRDCRRRHRGQGYMVPTCQLRWQFASIPMLID